MNNYGRFYRQKLPAHCSKTLSKSEAIEAVQKAITCHFLYLSLDCFLLMHPRFGRTGIRNM